IEDSGLELGIAQQLRPAPAPCPGLGIRIAGLIADLASTVAPQFPRDARWRAIQSRRNLPDRLPGRAPLGNLTPLFKADVPVPLFHRNTPERRCCTSFVKSANPGRVRACSSGLPLSRE